MPAPSSWVAHDVAEHRIRRRALCPGGTAEKETIAGIHDGDIIIPGHEGKGVTDQGRPACLTEIDESPCLAPAVRRVEKEAGEGLGEPVAVVGVGDEAAPVRGDALAAAERLDGQPREDLHDEVVGEAGRRRVRHPLVSLDRFAKKSTLPDFSDGGEL